MNIWWWLSVAQGMSLEQAVAGAQGQSPLLAVAAAREAEARARARQLDAGLYPQASLQGGAFWQNEVELDFLSQLPETLQGLVDPSEVEPLVIQPGFQLQAGAQATQPLVVPAVWAGRQAAEAGVDAAQAQQRAAVQELTLLVVEAWHASSQAQALEADAQRGLELAERLVEKGQALVVHGVAAPDEILPFEKAVASARANVALAAHGRDTASRVLEALTGIPGGADPAEVPGETPTLEASLEGLDRPDLRAAAAQVEAAQRALQAARAKRWPTVAAQGTLGWLDPAPELADTWNWKVGLGASVPVFQGGRLDAEADEASARVSLAQAGLEALRLRAENEVRTAHGALAMSQAELALRVLAVDLARRAVAAAELRMAEGSGSLLSLQQAQAELLAAEAQLTRARASAAREADRLRVARQGAI